jgi:hypothetical protein
MRDSRDRSKSLVSVDHSMLITTPFLGKIVGSQVVSALGNG